MALTSGSASAAVAADIKAATPVFAGASMPDTR